MKNLKENLSINNLMETYSNEDGTVDMIFYIDENKVVLRNEKMYIDENISKDSEEYEFYFDDEENVKRAIKEAEEKDIEYI